MSSLPTCVEEGFKTFLKNLVLCIWNEIIQTNNSTTKFECQASSKNKARLKVGEVCSRSKVCKRTKIKLKARPNVPWNKSKYRTCRCSKIKSKTTVRIAKIKYETRRRGRVKSKIRPKSTIKGKWNGD